MSGNSAPFNLALSVQGILVFPPLPSSFLPQYVFSACPLRFAPCICCTNFCEATIGPDRRPPICNSGWIELCWDRLFQGNSICTAACWTPSPKATATYHVQLGDCDGNRKSSIMPTISYVNQLEFPALRCGNRNHGYRRLPSSLELGGGLSHSQRATPIDSHS